MSVDDKAKSCIQMKVKNVPKELGNDLISDFAKDSKPSVYDITDIPSNDFRIDTSFKSVPMMNSKNENKVTISITGVKNGGNR